MLYKANFKDFVLNLSEKHKQAILEDDEHEYLFICFESYGSITKFELTNDDDNKYMSIVQDEENWTGMEYLLYVKELQEILKEDNR